MVRRKRMDRLDILGTLKRCGQPMSATELAVMLKRDRASISRILNAMAASKLVTKTRGPGMAVFYGYKPGAASDTETVIEPKEIEPSSLIKAAKYILSQNPWEPKLHRFTHITPLVIAELLQNGKITSDKLRQALEQYRDTLVSAREAVESYLAYNNQESIDYDTTVLIEQLVERYQSDQ